MSSEIEASRSVSRRRSATTLFGKALGNRSRRTLLDLLHEGNGQTLGGLRARLAMTRQSVTQHLRLLEDTNLIGTVRQGRERLHFINPVPFNKV